LTERQEIKNFVQCTLGCTCPEEVFDDIEQVFNVRLNNDIVVDERLRIGKRLLIYVIKMDSNERLISDFPTLVLAGRNERDSLAFNRFRLVIKTNNIDEIKPLAENLFEAMNINDEKIHLHVFEDEN
jgi:hypothetical protein